MHTRYQYGFNLLELMAAVAVLGILFSLGVPSFSHMIRDNRVVANTKEKRLLNSRGRPNFNVNYYVLDAQGRHAGVSL